MSAFEGKAAIRRSAAPVYRQAPGLVIVRGAGAGQEPIEEVAVGRDGLDFDLGRQIMQFHKSRQIQLRYGRTIPVSRGKVHYRWCFSDLLIARLFAEQFNGRFCKPTV
jgi:hypothetical protein